MSGSWLDFLLPATWNGVPFSVFSSEVVAGRKTAVHNYPFRDTVWVEDLGARGRQFSFRGFLVGDDCYVLEQAMHLAANRPGPGLLTHPTFGPIMAALVEFSSGQEAERGRSVTLNFRFIESAPQLFPGILFATVQAVLTLATAADGSVGGDYMARTAGPVALGEAVLLASVSVAGGFASKTVASVNDAGLLVNAVAALPPPAGTSFGRYSSGASGVLQVGVTTVGAALANVTAAQAAVAAAAAVVGSAALAAAGLPTAVQMLTEAVRAAASDPADQVRLLSVLAAYNPPSMPSAAPIGQAMQTVQTAGAALCRRAALTSLARACAAYSPTSYNDALALRQSVAALFDAEIQVAADGLDVPTYEALRALRTAVVLDLNTRAATLPALIEVTTPTPLPALSLAYLLYEDGSRADDVIARAHPVHPLFMPTDMVLLSA